MCWEKAALQIAAVVVVGVGGGVMGVGARWVHCTIALWEA